jgi:hypothetical protein
MDPVAWRLRLDPRDVDQQLWMRITARIESVVPDLRRHAAEPTAARTRVIDPPSLVPRPQRARPQQRARALTALCNSIHEGDTLTGGPKLYVARLVRQFFSRG